MAEIIERIVTGEKKLPPNLDWPSARLYHYMGLPIYLYTPLYVVSRVSGLERHVIEQADNNGSSVRGRELHRARGADVCANWKSGSRRHSANACYGAGISTAARNVMPCWFGVNWLTLTPVVPSSSSSLGSNSCSFFIRVAFVSLLTVVGRDAGAPREGIARGTHRDAEVEQRS